MIKRITILILILFLEGCAQNMQRYSGPEDMQNNKAIVITDLLAAHSVTFTKFDKNYNTDQRKEYSIAGILYHFVRLGTYRSVVFVTEPGIYFISKAIYMQGGYTYETTLSGLTPEGKVMYGAFEVKAGEVVYLGDLRFNWDKSSPNRVTTVDNYGLVVSELSASSEYKCLVAKLKHGTFYTAGSRIFLDDNNQARIEI